MNAFLAFCPEIGGSADDDLLTGQRDVHLVWHGLCSLSVTNTVDAQ